MNWLRQEFHDVKVEKTYVPFVSRQRNINFFVELWVADNSSSKLFWLNKTLIFLCY